MIRECLAGKNPVIFDEGQPPSTRQYIYVDDVVRAFTMLREQRRTGLWHLGTPDVLTQRQVVTAILEAVGDPKLRALEVEDDPRAKQYLWYIRNQNLDATKMWKEVRWEPQVSFAEGIKRTVRWWRDR